MIVFIKLDRFTVDFPVITRNLVGEYLKMPPKRRGKAALASAVKTPELQQ